MYDMITLMIPGKVCPAKMIASRENIFTFMKIYKAKALGTMLSLSGQKLTSEFFLGSLTSCKIVSSKRVVDRRMGHDNLKLPLGRVINLNPGTTLIFVISSEKGV